jgi:hypothetical protein
MAADDIVLPDLDFETIVVGIDMGLTYTGMFFPTSSSNNTCLALVIARIGDGIHY